MKTSEKILIASAKTINGTSFVGIRNYTNKQGEESNQTILAGYSLENALQSDFLSLQENKDKIFEALTQQYGGTLVNQAYTELFESLEKRLSSPEVKEKLRAENDQTIKRSDAQIDAYIQLAKGVKQNKESNEIHVFGLVMRKEIIKAIEYKQTKSADKTIVKNKIKKLCGFKQDKIRTFIFSDTEVKLQGVSITAK